MTALALLARAEAAGVTVRADGDRLGIKANVRPAPELLHALVGAKPELLELLAEREAAAAERAAIEGEPRLPPLGAAERDRADRDHARRVAGLLRAASAAIVAGE